MTRSVEHFPIVKDHELPGREFPRAVFLSVAVAYAWMMLAAWVAFGRGIEPDFELGFASLILVIGLGLPFLIFRTARRHMPWDKLTTAAFLSGNVDTATGPMPGRQAWAEVLIITAALALAATLIGIVYVLDGLH